MRGNRWGQKFKHYTLFAKMRRKTFAKVILVAGTSAFAWVLMWLVYLHGDALLIADVHPHGCRGDYPGIQQLPLGCGQTAGHEADAVNHSSTCRGGRWWGAALEAQDESSGGRTSMWLRAVETRGWHLDTSEAGDQRRFLGLAHRLLLVNRLDLEIKGQKISSLGLKRSRYLVSECL